MPTKSELCRHWARHDFVNLTLDSPNHWLGAEAARCWVASRYQDRSHFDVLTSHLTRTGKWQAHDGFLLSFATTSIHGMTDDGVKFLEKVFRETMT